MKKEAWLNMLEVAEKALAKARKAQREGDFSAKATEVAIAESRLHKVLAMKPAA